ncbi:unnamed protein product [Leuciscus chuanchicus]
MITLGVGQFLRARNPLALLQRARCQTCSSFHGDGQPNMKKFAVDLHLTKLEFSGSSSRISIIHATHMHFLCGTGGLILISTGEGNDVCGFPTAGNTSDFSLLLMPTHTNTHTSPSGFISIQSSEQAQSIHSVARKPPACIAATPPCRLI